MNPGSRGGDRFYISEGPPASVLHAFTLPPGE
jgi:hypothetical protein